MTKIDLEQFEGHTKGTWAFNPMNKKQFNLVTDDWTVDLRPYSSVTAEDVKQKEADIRLIASAPDLLKEVKELRKWIAQAVDVWKNCNHNDTQDWFNDFCEVHQQKEE